MKCINQRLESLPPKFWIQSTTQSLEKDWSFFKSFLVLTGKVWALLRHSKTGNGFMVFFSEKIRMVVLTNLHNPSGIYTDNTTIKAVAKIAYDHGASVLVDEIFLDGSFIKKPSCFGTPNLIVTSSATKIYGLGGLHTGWIIAPKEIAVQCQRMKAHTTGASSSYTSEIMTVYLLKNARDDVMKRFQKQATANHAVLKKWMMHHKDLMKWVEPDGGLVCFPKYSLKVPSIVFCKYLFETQKLLVNPGAFFHGEGHIRLSYGGDTDILQNGLEALADGLQDFHPTRLL